MNKIMKAPEEFLVSGNKDWIQVNKKEGPKKVKFLLKNGEVREKMINKPKTPEEIRDMLFFFPTYKEKNVPAAKKFYIHCSDCDGETKIRKGSKLFHLTILGV